LLRLLGLLLLSLCLRLSLSLLHHHLLLASGHLSLLLHLSLRILDLFAGLKGL